MSPVDNGVRNPSLISQRPRRSTKQSNSLVSSICLSCRCHELSRDDIRDKRQTIREKDLTRTELLSNWTFQLSGPARMTLTVENQDLDLVICCEVRNARVNCSISMISLLFEFISDIVFLQWLSPFRVLGSLQEFVYLIFSCFLQKWL
jgi:hypothetical protein